MRNLSPQSVLPVRTGGLEGRLRVGEQILAGLGGLRCRVDRLLSSASVELACQPVSAVGTEMRTASELEFHRRSKCFLPPSNRGAIPGRVLSRQAVAPCAQEKCSRKYFYRANASLELI
jgi:hypothetical protein